MKLSVKSELYLCFNQIYEFIEKSLLFISQSADVIEQIKIENAILVVKLNELKVNLGKTECRSEIQKKFLFGIIAMYDRMIFDILSEKNINNFNHKTISLEVYYFSTSQSGTILFENIAEALHSNDRELLFVYLKILAIAFSNKNISDSIDLQKIKKEIFECVFGEYKNNSREDLFVESNQRYDIEIINTNIYRNILIAAICGYLIITSIVWYFATHDLYAALNSIKT